MAYGVHEWLRDHYHALAVLPVLESGGTDVGRSRPVFCVLAAVVVVADVRPSVVSVGESLATDVCGSVVSATEEGDSLITGLVVLAKAVGLSLVTGSVVLAVVCKSSNV